MKKSALSKLWYYHAFCSAIAQELAPPTLEILAFDALRDVRRPDDGPAGLRAAQTAQAAMPGLLLAALVPYKFIRVVAIPGNQSTLLTSSGQRRSDRGVSAANSEIGQAEFFVRGVITNRGAKLVANTVVGNRATGATKSLGPVSMRLDRLNIGAEDLAFDVVSEIARQKQIQLRRRSIVVACTRDQAGPLRQLDRRIQNGTESIVQNLIVSSTERLIAWTLGTGRDCASGVSLKDLAQRGRADAVIALKAMSAKRTARGAADAIKVVMYILDEDRSIAMPDIALDLGRDGVDDASYQFANLSHVTVGSVGNWITSEIPLTEQSATTYLDLAKQVEAKPDGGEERWTALKDYFLNMAVSHSSELSKSAASDARYRLAQIRLAADRLGDATRLLNRAANLDPSNIDIRLAQADLSAQQDDAAQAVSQYKAIISQFPGRPEAYERLGALLTIQGKPRDAEDVYRSAIRAAPAESIAAYRGLASILLTKADVGQDGYWLEPAAILEAGQTGLRDEKQRLDLMRDLSALYADAGRTRYLKEDYSAAIELLDKSIAVMPTSKGYFFRANTYYRFAQKERQPENRALAIADYRQVVQIAEAAKQPAVNPEYIGSLLTILELFTLETRYTEAIAWADHAVEIFNANKEALSFESVARLIRLAAKIAGDKPDYRQDAEELDKMMTAVSRAYSFGSFVWEFEPVDDFMKTNPNISDSLRCLYLQISLEVQKGRTQTESPIAGRCN